MKTAVRTVVMTAFLLLLFCCGHARAASEDATLYFNAGTEKYLQGNFTEAVENLEKAQALDPQNRKINGFMVKILLEAATQNHMKHNYRQAMIYIEKAQKLAPDNPKVQELYTLTKGLVSPTAEKIAREPEAKPKPAPPAEQPAPAARREEKKGRKEAAPAVLPVPAAGQSRFAQPVAARDRRPGTTCVPALVWGGVSTALFVTVLILYAASQKRKRELEATAQRLRDENAALSVEYARLKEGVRYEHQIAEQYHKDLQEKIRLEEGRVKMELDLRTKQIHEKVRAELMSRNVQNDGGQEAFLHQQQAKFLEYIGDTSTRDDIPSPALESVRERIAIMAENLFAYAPGAALDFLKNMAKNPNPLIRANIVQALIRIGRAESMSMLFELYDDPDYRVKREILKNLKQLHQKISARAVTMEQAIQDKVNMILQAEKEKGEWIL